MKTFILKRIIDNTDPCNRCGKDASRGFYCEVKEGQRVHFEIVCRDCHRKYSTEKND